MVKLEETPEALAFADSLEKACVDTVNVDGIMTKNLAIACGKIEKENWCQHNWVYGCGGEEGEDET